MGCHFLLQEIFPIQGLNPGLPHYRQMVYHPSHQGRHGMWWVDLKYSFQFYDSVISLVMFYLCYRSSWWNISFFLKSILEIGLPVFLWVTCHIEKQESTQDKADMYQRFSQKANAMSCVWSTQYLSGLPQLPVFKTVTRVKNHDFEAL